MIYLLLAILSSSAVSLIMRISERFSKNNISMLACNYLLCGALGALYTGSASLFPTKGGLGLTLFMGVIGGILFLTSFVMFQWNIHKNGVLMPTTFMKLGVIIPTILSILVFGEQPRIVQIIGILLAVGAIIIMNGGGGESVKNTAGLVLLLLTTGFCNAMSKIFEEIGPAAFKNHFLFYIFTTAFIFCVGLCLVKGQRLAVADVVCGFAIGVPNYFSTRFMLLSLAEIPATVAYPTYSVASILLVALVGLVLFKERISRRKALSLGIILVAIAMLNL